MKIRFKKGDPREGMVAEFNSSRGQELVDAGAAVEVKGDQPEAQDAPAQAKAAGKAADKPAGKAAQKKAG